MLTHNFKVRGAVGSPAVRLARSDAGLPAQPASSAEAFAAWRRGEGSLLLCVYSYLMTSVSAAVEVSPGEEFRVALQEARQAGPQPSMLMCAGLVVCPSGGREPAKRAGGSMG